MIIDPDFASHGIPSSPDGFERPVVAPMAEQELGPDGRRYFLIAKAIRGLGEAAAGSSDPLKATAEALDCLIQAAHNSGSAVPSCVLDNVDRALKAAMFSVVAAVGDDLSHERVAVNLGAASIAFRVCCGGAEECEGKTLEYAQMLADALSWSRNALAELYYRRRIAAGGDALFRDRTARLVFNNAAPGEHAH